MSGPHGLFLILTTSTVTRFGTLQDQKFTDLTSPLSQGYHLSSSNGFLTPNRFQYSTLLQGDDLYLTGLISQNTMALLRYNLDTRQATDYSPLLASTPGTPIQLAYTNGQLYIAGFRSIQASPQPLLVQINLRTLTVNDITNNVPASFGSIGGLATDGQSLFVAGGAFLNVDYGTITSDSEVQRR